MSNFAGVFVGAFLALIFGMITGVLDFSSLIEFFSNIF